MKNIAKIIALITLSLNIISCDDYLEKSPLDETSDVTNWSSEAALETYAWSFYDNFIGYGTSRGQYFNSPLSDNMCMVTYVEPTKTIPSTSSLWEDPYEEIRRANILLARVDITPDMDDESANHWRGVARFFRAMKHAELVQTYGDVVWIDSEVDVDDSETLSKPRDPREEVMKNVCADLQFAGENCKYATTNTVSNMVAWALLSRVALHEAAWQKYHENNVANALTFYEIAKGAANSVISSGYYSIHTEYVQNYISKTLLGNSEMLLYKAYSHTSEGASVTFAHGTQAYSAAESSSSITKSGIESYVMANGLPIHMGDYSDVSALDIFGNRDARLLQTVDADIICPRGYEYTKGVYSTTGYYTDKFVDWNDYNTATWALPNNTTDAPLYSYSEVLVNYAEACAEIEDLGGALMTQADLDKSVNLTRVNHGSVPALTYAGKGLLSVNGTVITQDPKNDTGISVLLWELRRERRNELMCDGFRYNDLLRWKLGRYIDFTANPECYMGISREAIDEFYENTKNESLYLDCIYQDIIDLNFWTSDGKYVSAFNLDINNRVFDESKNYLEPIPSTEITLNPSLTQNLGWN